MSKKIMLLALTVVSAAAFALPTMAMGEDVPNHLTSKPTAVNKIIGGAVTLQTKGGTKITCEEVVGEAEWESPTTGWVTMTFKKGCKESVFNSSCGEIMSTRVQFHLITGPNGERWKLYTNPAGHLETFSCGFGLLNVAVTGNGFIVAMSNACGSESLTSTETASQTGGVQSQKLVSGTTTEYHLETSLNGGAKEEAGLTFSDTLTFESNKKLECT